MYFEHRPLYIINIAEIQTREICFTLSRLRFACANFSATTRLVGYMCPARRCGTSMKLFSSVQYSDLINVYITFFLCSIYDKYERERQRGRELCSGLDYSL